MARSTSSSDDEGPESFSFGTLKDAAKQRESQLQQFQTAQRQRKKERNKERDKTLKERASQSKKEPKGKSVIVEIAEEDDDETNMRAGKASDPERDDLEDRMERAMREAEDESGLGSEESDPEMGAGKLEFRDEDEHEAVEEEGTGDEDEGMSEQEEIDQQESSEDEESLISSKNPNYLPDHVFASAFSKAEPPSLASSLKRKAKQTSSQPTTKRRRIRKPKKDIIIGSRTIRTLPQTGQRGISSAVSTPLQPPGKINKFLSRSLNLSGSSANAKVRGWERISANLGVLRRNGPAAHFARNS